MARLVTIPSASAEYQAHFERPCIGFIGLDRPRVVEALVNVLLPYNFNLADSDVVTAGTLADQKMNFRIPKRGISLSVTAEQYRFIKEGADWENAEEGARILKAAEDALLAVSTAKISRCMVTVAMHVQHLTKPREDILAPFVPVPFRALVRERDATSYGNHLKWASGEVLLDFSAVFANGLFIRFSCEFPGRPPFEEVLARMKSEELALFQILGLEGGNE